jgi:hypothetical protein
MTCTTKYYLHAVYLFDIISEVMCYILYSNHIHVAHVMHGVVDYITYTVLCSIRASLTLLSCYDHYATECQHVQV